MNRFGGVRAARIVVALVVAASVAGLGDVAPAAAATPVITAVSAGWYHTCALTSTGGVKCWGDNSVGQLGNGTVTPGEATPVDVTGLTSGVAAIAVGGAESCALTTTGGVKCWGNNNHGQLGIGTIDTYRTTPVDVSGLSSGVASIAVGSFYACAVMSGGGVKCWGWDQYGSLGDNDPSTGTTIVEHPTPVDVYQLTGAVMASAGGRQGCAVRSTGGLKCWGHNLYGQVGDGTFVDRYAPVDVASLTSGVTAVSAGGRHTCALTSGGGAKCWGLDDFGELGDNSTTNKSSPQDVVGLTSGVAKITAGRWHTCAITTASSAKCWGDINGAGEIDDPRVTTPQDVPGGLSGVTDISAGEDHTCALTSVGGVKCWGQNDIGQLGTGIPSARSDTPVDVVWTTPPNRTATTTTLTSSPNPSDTGQTVTFTATVSPSTATGTVSFNEGGTSLGTGTLSGGTAILTTSLLSAGPHTVTAVYTGDSSFAGSSSTSVTQTVNDASAKTATTTSLSSSPNPSNTGQAVTFTARVTPASGTVTPTGTVTFNEGTSSLGAGSLSGGTATFSTSSLSAGPHNVSAVYGGDANFTGSTSASVTQTVNTGTTVSPTSVKISTGALAGGSVSSLQADDDNYYVVRSTTRTTSWFATFTGVPKALNSLTVRYVGKESSTATQVIYVYRYSTKTWVQVDSRSAGTVDGTVNLTPTGAPGDYVSSTGQMRIRVKSQAASGALTTSADLLQVTYTT